MLLHQLFYFFFVCFACGSDTLYLYIGRGRRNIGVEATAGSGDELRRNVFFLYAGVMYEKAIDARLHVFQIIGIGRPFVAAGAAGGIVIDRRRAAPEIVVFGKALPFEGIADYFTVDGDCFSFAFGRGRLGDAPDEQRVYDAEEDDTDEGEPKCRNDMLFHVFII